MLSPETTEGQWVISQHEQAGFSVEEIVANVDKLIGGYGPDKSNTRLVVEYQLGKRPFSDVQHLLLPHQPTGVTFVQNTNDGYLCRTSGSPTATFDVLFKTPTLSEADLRDLLERNQSEIAFIAYKNAHEGHPYGYSLMVDGVLTHPAARAGISYTDIRHLLP